MINDQELQVASLSITGSFLRTAITLDVEKTEAGDWLVSDPVMATYGTGDTLDAAVQDFGSMLRDLFEELLATESVLAPHLQRQLDYLRTIVVERPSV